MMLIRLIGLILIISFGCSKPEQPIAEKLKGHWHAVGSIRGGMKTLDIYDSMSFSDHYSMLGPGWQYSIYDSDGQIVLPDMCCGEAFTSCVDKFHISNDTLVYDTSYSGACSVTKFVRSDLTKCRWTHAFEHSSLELSHLPMQSKKLLDVDSARRISHHAVIMVGLLKDSTKSPKIQVEDVLLSIKDIPVYVLRSKLNYPDKSEFAVCLIVDERVRKSFADSVINAIPKSDSIKFFRLVKAKGSEELGYERIPYPVTN